MLKLKDLIPLFESLAGSKANELDQVSSNIEIFNNKGLGYSQFNEILLLLGFKRVSYEFFQYLSDGSFTYHRDTSIDSRDQFKAGLNRFTILALLFFGNIKFAYKELASNSDKLFDTILESLPTDIKDFTKRHKPLRDIIKIPPDKTYFLGYLIEREIRRRIKANPNDKEALELEEERMKYVKIGESNQIVYLSSDHLDVYVATSMRLPHEFLFVNKVINEIFSDKKIKKLKLRCFDPTQAYCNNRIDKGLSEALMLKTALCTLYLAQESETLGKDSELASTLAQGKAVIAYVPIGDKRYVDDLLTNLMRYNNGRSEKEIIFEQLKIYSPCLAWKSEKIRSWLDNIENAPLLEMKEQLYTLAEDYYDNREEILKHNHPLGIQVNLKSGVANGVLVVRTIEDCKNLMRNIILNEMDFYIEKNPGNQIGYIYLKEKISGCIFRLKTGNSLLTNTFWNFYIQD
jgi:hypothetical protein